MKWIGQHIYDLVSRFREDVYLEDLTTDSSTDILVVDSNGKICKNAAAGDDMTFNVTGDSGTPEAIVDGNTLDIAGGNAITTVVSSTDTVTVNHDDTSSQASVDNSGRTFIQDITLDTYGHVTGITSATDADTYSGTVTSIATSGTENGLTLTGGTITGSGTITLGGTLAINNSDWSGTDLSVANGGTGASTLTDNSVLTGTGTSAITAEAALTFDTAVGSLKTVQTLTTSASTPKAMEIDANYSGDLAQDSTGLYVDFDRTIPGSGTAVHNDIGIDLDVSAPSRGAGTVAGIDIDVVASSTGGNHVRGIDIKTVGTTGGDNIGILSEITDNGATHLRLQHNVGDYADFNMASDGALEIATTTNSGSSTADITLDAAGDIVLEAAGGDVTMDSNLTITGGNIKMAANANDYVTFALADTGDLTVTTVGDGTTDSDITITADGALKLLSANIDGARKHGITGGTGIPMGIHHYNFAGYAEGIGANWMYPDPWSDNKSPFEIVNDWGDSDIDSGSPGWDATGSNGVAQWFRCGRYIVGRDCTTIGWNGWTTANQSETDEQGIAIIRVRPTAGGGATTLAGGSPSIQLIREWIFDGNASNGNHKPEYVGVSAAGETFRVNLNKGDILIPMAKGTSGADVYFNVNLEVEWRDS